MKESVGILIIARDTNNFLLLHRSDIPIVWSILTGTMDVDGETPLDCVKREIEEEIRVDSSHIQNIKLLDTITNDYGLFHVFVGFVDNEFEPNLKLDENDDYVWTNQGNLPKPIHKGWNKTFQLVKPILNLRESINKKLKRLLNG